MLILRPPRVSQPQAGLAVNQGNPLTRGLILLSSPGLQGGNAALGGALTASTKTVPTATPSGIALAHDTDNAAFYAASVAGIGTTYTMLTLAQNVSEARRVTALMIGDESGGTGNAQIVVALNCDSSGAPAAGTAAFFDFQSGFKLQVQATSSVDDDFHVWAAKRDGANGSLWRDGVSVGATGAASGTTTPADTIYVSGSSAATTRYVRRQVLSAVWNRALSDAEIRSVSANPWRLFAPLRRRLWVPSTATGAGSTGTLARTNANDTLAASGTTTVLGTLARTNANDTSAAAGTTTVAGTLAKTNASDTSAAAGTTTVTGALARTNANDTSAASGSVGAVTGTLAKTNANDTSAASGTTTIVGTLARTNANDSVAASGAAPPTGTLARTNANDSVAAAGTTKIVGTLAYTNANDRVLVQSGSTGAVIMLPIRLISGVYTTTGVNASRALQNLRTFLPHSSVEIVPGMKVNAQWYRFFQMFVDVFIGGSGAYTLQDILDFVATSQANATQQALTTSAIAQQLQGVAEATAVVKQVAVSNSLSGADQIPDVPLSRGMEP